MTNPSNRNWTGIIHSMSVILATFTVTQTATGESRFATSHDGLQLHYQVEGRGVPMVLLAGGPGRYYRIVGVPLLRE